jgi:hypothetical protein
MAVMVIDVLLFEHTGDIEQFSTVTGLPGISLSVLYYEPEVRLYKDFSGVIYPDMKPISYMDFVYAR